MKTNTSDADQGQWPYQRRLGRTKDISPRVGAKNLKSAAEKELSLGEVVEQHERPDAEHIGQDEQRAMGASPKRSK